MSESDKVTTLFKRALGVVSTFKNTPWYSETNIRQRNIVEATDINIEKTPELPEWSDSSLNSATMSTLGFDLDASDFPASDSSFTTLHLYSSNIYTVNGERLPGMYLDESVSDSSGVVALFVRLKLDKMEGDENLDPSAIAYVKIRRNEEKISSPSVKWGGSYLSLIDTTTQITYSSDGVNFSKYTDTLSRYIDFSTAVAIFEINTDDSNNVILEQETEVFLIKKSTGWSYVSTDGWTLIDTDNASIGYFLDRYSNNDMQLFRRVYQPGTYYFDNCSALYIFQRLYTTSIMDNAYEFSYKTQTNVGSIDVFKPYNYTLEYYDSDFVTLEHSNGNWIFDNDTGIITFEENPTKANSENIDLDIVDLYFTFVKYIGVQGLENLMYYKNGKIGIGNKNPQYELDVSGSVNITGDLEIDNDLKISGGTMFVDSTNYSIGINKINPSSTLDVSGNVAVSNSLTITNGVGNGGGFCPIGAIIMWPTSDFTNSNLFGEWNLCDGTELSATDYQDLSNAIGSSNNTIHLPDFSNRFIKGAKSGESTITYGGSNSASFDICLNHIPVHDHNVTPHNHEISGNDEHVHQTKPHSHTITDNEHTHQTKAHSHSISDIGHSHTLSAHSHDIDDSGHSHVHDSHTHSFDAKHKHNYNRPHVVSTQNINLGKGSNQNSAAAYKNCGFSSNLNTSTVNASSNYTIVAAGGDSKEPDSFSVSINVDGNKNVATNSADSGITMLESGGADTSGCDAAVLQTTLSISDNLTLTSSTETSDVNISNNITIDNHQITTDANDAADTITMNCVVNPLFHSLFFFIRIA